MSKIVRKSDILNAFQVPETAKDTDLSKIKAGVWLINIEGDLSIIDNATYLEVYAPFVSREKGRSNMEKSPTKSIGKIKVG